MTTEWKKVRLGEICDYVTSGGTPLASRNDYYNPPVIPWLKTKEVNYSRITKTENFISQKGLDNSSAKLIPENSVIVAMYGQGDTAGRVAINKIPLTTNQACCNFIIDKEKADYNFIYYQLCTLYDKMVSLKSGGAQPNLNAGKLKELEISLPPLETQQKIAGILSAYDDLIENNRKQIKLLEEAAQKLYKEWFVKLNFPGHENVKIVDGVPEGWKKVRAEDYFEVTIGKTPPRNETKWFSKGNIGKKWISIADMGNSGVFIFQTSENLTNEAIESKNVKIVPANTVLLSFKLTVGRVSITTEEMTTNEAIAHFVTDNRFIREYLYLNLKNFHYDSLGSTSAISTAINSKIVKSMPIIIPSESLLENFSKLAAPYFDKIKSLQNQIQLLQFARDKLLPKLMNGEVEIDSETS